MSRVSSSRAASSKTEFEANREKGQVSSVLPPSLLKPSEKEIKVTVALIAAFLKSEFAIHSDLIDGLKGFIIPDTFAPEQLLHSRDTADWTRVQFLLPYLGLRDIDLFAGERRGADEATLIKDAKIVRGCEILCWLANNDR